jgi:hypothetical protein
LGKAVIKHLLTADTFLPRLPPSLLLLLLLLLLQPSAVKSATSSSFLTRASTQHCRQFCC